MNPSVTTVILIAFSLSMDAFAVSLSYGCSLDKHDLKKSSLIALFFGGFQGIMPLIGFYAGSLFVGFFYEAANLLAALILGYIGLKMIYESFKYQTSVAHDISLKDILILSVATSIDALAVGLSFSFLNYRIIIPAIIITIITFILSFIGVHSGFAFKEKVGKYSEVVGGLILLYLAFSVYF